MDESRFWNLIGSVCRSDPKRAEQWDQDLVEALAQLPADDIVEWNHIFDRMAANAYSVDLWGAAYLINGGASDDGFYYFRCWLIGMGREVYEAALEDPDSLADAVDPKIDAEAGIYAAAHQAWMRVTGRPDTDLYPARNEQAELKGEEWDFEDRNEVERRMPRLSTLYD